LNVVLIVAACPNNLVLLLWSQGKRSLVEPLFRKALRTRRKTLGDRHPNVADSLNNLTQKKFAVAESLYRESLAIRRKVFGDHDPSVAQSLNNLAALHRIQGNKRATVEKEAELMWKQAETYSLLSSICWFTLTLQYVLH